MAFGEDCNVTDCDETIARREPFEREYGVEKVLDTCIRKVNVYDM